MIVQCFVRHSDGFYSLEAIWHPPYAYNSRPIFRNWLWSSAEMFCNARLFLGDAEYKEYNSSMKEMNRLTPTTSLITSFTDSSSLWDMQWNVNSLYWEFCFSLEPTHQTYNQSWHLHRLLQDQPYFPSKICHKAPNFQNISILPQWWHQHLELLIPIIQRKHK